MFRYLLLIPFLLLSVLAFQAHDEAEKLSIDTINPDDDPRFNPIAGMNTFERITVDPDLASAYNNASITYNQSKDYFDNRTRDLHEQRNRYLVFMGLIAGLFTSSFMPWLKLTKTMSDELYEHIDQSKLAASKLLRKVSDTDRTIVRRAGIDRFSVSAELKNWKDLYDQGVVSEEEFEKAKTKLLGRK